VTGDVVAMERLPVHQSTIVRAPRGHTFGVFVDHLAHWWPLDPFSYGGSSRVVRVKVEGRIGGAVVEHWHDDSTHTWGTVLEWDPPTGFTMTWNITGTPTEVQLRFTAVDSQTTRVDVDHRGWDQLSLDELTAACGLPGGYAGGAFNRGWSIILQSLKEHFEP